MSDLDRDEKWVNKYVRDLIEEEHKRNIMESEKVRIKKKYKRQEKHKKNFKNWGLDDGRA